MDVEAESTAAKKTEAETGPPVVAQVERSIRIETEALVAGLVAGVLGGVFGAFLFWNRWVALWGDWDAGWSVGTAGVVAVIVAGALSSGIGYWRSRRLPNQRWRRSLQLWKAIVDTIAVAIVHTAIAVLIAAAVFFVAQLAFRRLLVDGPTAIGSLVIAAALAAYGLYLAVSQLTTVTMAQRLLLFMASGVIVSMATSSDPVWWRYHFSHLGTLGNTQSIVFNVTLVVAGTLVTTFALYVDRDIRTLHDRGVIAHAWSAPVVTVLFIAMGIGLAGIGLVPVNLTIIGHNVFAAGTSIAFAILLIISPIVLRGMPLAFFLTTLAFFVALLGAVWLNLNDAYFNLTAFELAAFVILFGWIAIFVRFVAALLGIGTGAGTEAPAPE